MDKKQEPKYDVNADGRIFNRATGEVIPDDEPIFIFRARDARAAPELLNYRGNCVDPTQIEAVGRRHKDFERFASEHPERMKEPDTVLSDAPAPATSSQLHEALALITSERIEGERSWKQPLIIQLTDRYEPSKIPPCRVCGGPLSIQSVGGGEPTRWGCSGHEDGPSMKYKPGRSMSDEHYSRSIFEDRRQGGDSDVMALIDAARTLAAALGGHRDG